MNYHNEDLFIVSAGLLDDNLFRFFLSANMQAYETYMVPYMHEPIEKVDDAPFDLSLICEIAIACKDIIIFETQNVIDRSSIKEKTYSSTYSSTPWLVSPALDAAIYTGDPYKKLLETIKNDPSLGAKDLDYLGVLRFAPG